MEKFNTNTKICEIGIENDIFKFRVATNIFTKYEVEVKNGDKIFEGKIIIKNIEILNKILCENFRGCFDSNVSFEIFNDKCTVNIKIETTYVNETLSIELPKVSNPISMEMLIQYIDGVKSALEAKHDTDLQKLIEGCNKNFQDLKTALEQTRKDLLILDDKFENYKTSHPIFVGYKYNNIRTININCNELHLFNEKGIYYIGNYYRIYRFNWDDMRYLQKLEKLTLKNCNVASLEFLQCFETLRELTLSDMGSLESIGWLKQFYNLEKLYIVGKNNINDLNDLYMCPKLNTLIIPKNKHVNFPPKTPIKIFRQ